MALRIDGGQVLLDGAFATGVVGIQDGHIAPPSSTCRSIDATGLLVLPGIVDLHGDAFERQVQPRPGVEFPMAIAVAETEAQLLASGITTA